jgi:oxygen-independent coproporphyrinogen-3 oxidase
LIGIKAFRPRTSNKCGMSIESTVLAEQSVPRYTSYPTAPHFAAAVGSDTYAAWLAELPPSQALSLYLHVPFCAELCLYCGCHTKAVRRREPLDDYAQSLIKEIALVRRRLGTRKVSHLHWGGGTPSMLGGSKLTEITDRLADAFDLAAVREHAIELDPRHVGRPLVRSLAGIGVNRASLGVQDFAPHVQQAIGRIQPYEMVELALGTLREFGIARINFDLMYGLPRQTIRDIRRNIALAVSLNPDRIALFGYAHVPWFRTQQRLIDAATLPGPAERLAQMEAAREALVAFGYEPIGLDHFALPTDDLAVAAKTRRLRRNFQGYTTDDALALIGLGASAIGRLPQGFVQNAPDTGGWARAVSADRLATARGLALSDDDRLRGEIIERLMCDLRVDLPSVVPDSGPAHDFAEEREALQALESQGIVRIAGDTIALTASGRPFVRLVAAVFDDYLRRSERRHSVAV